MNYSSPHPNAGDGAVSPAGEGRKEFFGGELPIVSQRVQEAMSAEAARGEGAPYDIVMGQVREKVRQALTPAQLERPTGEDKGLVLRLILEEIERFNRHAESYGRPTLPGDREEVARQMLYAILGLGPLEPLLEDETIEDIYINGPNEVIVTGEGGVEVRAVDFGTPEMLMEILNRALAATGRRLDFQSPTVDAQLSDGSRLHAAIAPIAEPWPLVTIRRHRLVATTMEDLIRLETVTPEAARFLEAAVKSYCSILVCGATASGKTNTINCLSSYFDPMEAKLVIEDTRELQLKGHNVRYLVTRPPSVEGRGEITQADLVKQALRMRPRRIVFGEVRGAEAWDMCNAGNTGHDGLIAGVHANNPRDAVERIATLARRGVQNVPEEIILREVVRAFMLVVHQEFDHATGRRHVREIAEITGNVEGLNAVIQPIFRWEGEGLRWSGNRPYPRLQEQLVKGGYDYDALFEGVEPGGSNGLW